MAGVKATCLVTLAMVGRWKKGLVEGWRTVIAWPWFSFFFPRQVRPANLRPGI